MVHSDASSQWQTPSTVSPEEVLGGLAQPGASDRKQSGSAILNGIQDPLPGHSVESVGTIELQHHRLKQRARQSSHSLVDVLAASRPTDRVLKLAATLLYLLTKNKGQAAQAAEHLSTEPRATGRSLPFCFRRAKTLVGAQEIIAASRAWSSKLAALQCSNLEPLGPGAARRGQRQRNLATKAPLTSSPTGTDPSHRMPSKDSLRQPLATALATTESSMKASMLRTCSLTVSCRFPLPRLA